MLNTKSSNSVSDCGASFLKDLDSSNTATFHMSLLSMAEASQLGYLNILCISNTTVFTFRDSYNERSQSLHWRTGSAKHKWSVSLDITSYACIIHKAFQQFDGISDFLMKHTQHVSRTDGIKSSYRHKLQNPQKKYLLSKTSSFTIY